ncbi:MAG: phosphoenolpyruvate synthase [Candidatus Dependentiae bacterium]|nr:phosphoenolpyruvate synthase [Candidatus Dependentiae bacterium]
MKYIKKFEEISIDDISLVGGKNASLGQMITHLSSAEITIPTGFTITTDGYWHYIDHNHFLAPMKHIMSQLVDITDTDLLAHTGHEMRALLSSGTMPADMAQEIYLAYHDLAIYYNSDNCDVAVRSSATAEDLPTASFAGQQETFLHISGIDNLIQACINCIASLFTDRAIIYRENQHLDHFKVALSVGVQKMVRSDISSSGVAFSLDTETGFKDVVMIESSYGLGESIVQGLVTPDSFLVHKPTLLQGYTPIIKKKLGNKSTALIYSDKKSVINQTVSTEKQSQFSITDSDIITIARAVLQIEKHYSQRAGIWVPMDVEWAKDGIDGKIYIVQARPETIYGAKKQSHSITTYTLQAHNLPEHKHQLLISGQSIGNHIISGTARVIKDASLLSLVQPGDIIVTEMTDPDWLPVMKRAAGIITARGGRTCHAAIVSRELGIPAIVGAQQALELIKDGQEVTLDCSRGSQGFIYAGHIPFDTQTYQLDTIPHIPIEIMVNIADPDSAFSVAALPTQGVGLARIEFIISSIIKVHPLALIYPDKVTDVAERETIQHLTAAYDSPLSFFIDTLAQGIGLIAAAFYPRPVIVRLSDFKTNEYRTLIGGSYFEPVEENPMIGLRGASRYCHKEYTHAFMLECQALKKVREQMGLTNITIMVPFVRTVPEAQKVVEALKQNGLERGATDTHGNRLSIIMMCEIPSNVILIDEFSTLFDGFSIGSNDLTQLTLGVDRDSSLVANLFDERDPAMKKMFTWAIEGAKRNKRHIGMCGQAPSDYPELADFLIKAGINSLSLNADSVLPFLMRFVGKNSP